jgi:hypothetical protein
LLAKGLLSAVREILACVQVLFVVLLQEQTSSLAGPRAVTYLEQPVYIASQ